MKKVFFFSLIATLALSLQAVTINWKLYNYEHQNDTTVQSGTDGQIGWADSIGYAMIVHTTSDSAATSADAFKAQYNGTGTTKIGLSTVTPNASGIISFKTDTTLADTGYYYLVIFDEQPSSTDLFAGKYAVSSAITYTGLEKGITDLTVGGATGTPQDPELGNYVDVPWMGGTWKAPSKAPEPTVLALLALGIAGTALRRKVA